MHVRNINWPNRSNVNRSIIRNLFVSLFFVCSTQLLAEGLTVLEEVVVEQTAEADEPEADLPLGIDIRG